ncbi:MAG: flagellar filament capping protein FliD [Lachnospiraceae bacterium]|nr:flagellar filament capping protein FliD [Lachnospiraceae bacterium]
MAIRLSGLASGLDTDSIVQELVSAYSTKKTNIEKAQTKLEWTQDAWKDMNSKIYSFYSKSLSTMRFSKSYAQKNSSISNSGVAKVTASNSAVNGTQTLKVSKLATSGYLTGGKVSGKDGAKLTSSSTLGDFAGMSALTDLGSIDISVGDETKTINLSSDMTVSSFVSALKDAGVNASFDAKNQRFFVSATNSGAEYDFDLQANSASGVKALSALGLYAPTTTEKAAYTEAASWTDEKIATMAQADYEGSAYTTESITEELQTELNTLTTELGTLNDSLTYKQAKVDYLSTAIQGSGDTATWAAGYETAEARNAAMQTVIDDLQAQIDALGEGEDATSLENQLKAAKEVQTALSSDTATPASISSLSDTAASAVTQAQEEIATKNARVEEINNLLNDSDALAEYLTTKNQELYDSYVERYTNQRAAAAEALATTADTSEDGPTRIVGEDAVIYLNNAKFTNNTNSFEINGLTIQATGLTGDEAVTITTDTDTEGIYDMVKNFFTEYNTLMKSMDTAYYASSAKGYEPLSDEEKESMTDTQIEKWETKVKDALLRRDNTLGTLSSSMKSLMAGTYSHNGTTISLATLGIKTSGYFSADQEERGLYHIDGDEDDETSSANEDKLRAMIASDPDAVVGLISSLSTKVYNMLSNKMASTSLSSAYTVYNDKQMKTQYSNYTTQISDWEEKIADYEDKYYKQFSAMESALASLNSQQSQLAGLLG